MSLSQALSTSVSGLRTAQAGLALVAANVANAQTPGYVRKSMLLETSSAGAGATGVRVAEVTRELDQYVQRQLRVEMSGGAYAGMRAEFYQRLQAVYGPPGAPSSLESVFNNFTTAVQALATSPETTTARSAVLTSAQVLVQQLNGMSTDIQGLRSDAERNLDEAVATANEAMRQIASINGQLATAPASDAATASLEDQRDAFIDQLADLMDIKVVKGPQGQANVFTNSGVQLVGTAASKLSFNAQGTMTPQSLWSADPAQSTVGGLTLMSPSGGQLDLIASKSIRAGRIAALIEMRDTVLVEAQTQLDGLAAAMASTLSDKTVDGSPVTSGAQSGMELDTTGLLPGNAIHLTYTDTATGAQHRVSIVRVEDPAALPLKDTDTADPLDKVIGVSFAGGLASVVSQLNGQFNGKITFSSPSAGVLRVLDDGAANNTDIASFTATQTVTSLTGGSAEFAFFTDTHNAYSGAITSTGPQSVGLAARLAVNASLLADPAKLVAFSATSAIGDPTRPDFIYERLTNTALGFSPKTGIGSSSTPFSGTVPTYLRQFLSQQGGNAEAASNLAEGQNVVVNALKQRVADGSSVNVDKEMANLLTLQTAYGANARVMSTIKDMLDTLMKI